MWYRWLMLWSVFSAEKTYLQKHYGMEDGFYANCFLIARQNLIANISRCYMYVGFKMSFFWVTLSLSPLPLVIIYQFRAYGRFRMRNAEVPLLGRLKVPGRTYSSQYCLMSGKSANEASKEANVGF